MALPTLLAAWQFTAASSICWRSFATTAELASLEDWKIGTDIGCAGCRRVERTALILWRTHTHTLLYLSRLLSLWTSCPWQILFRACMTSLFSLFCIAWRILSHLGWRKPERKGIQGSKEPDRLLIVGRHCLSYSYHKLLRLPGRRCCCMFCHYFVCLFFPRARSHTAVWCGGFVALACFCAVCHISFWAARLFLFFVFCFCLSDLLPFVFFLFLSFRLPISCPSYPVRWHCVELRLFLDTWYCTITMYSYVLQVSLLFGSFVTTELVPLY